MRRKIRALQFMPVLLVASAAIGAEPIEPADPFAEPSSAYLRAFANPSERVFVLERFDASGLLVSRETGAATEPISIGGATRRTIAGRDISLRGLRACPDKMVNYNQTETWPCAKAAADYAGTIYNERAKVSLCKTLVLDTQRRDPIPASCFALVGGDGEPFRVANDDDAMVFLGLARIERTLDVRSRRPDLEHSQALGQSAGHKNAR